MHKTLRRSVSVFVAVTITALLVYGIVRVGGVVFPGTTATASVTTSASSPGAPPPSRRSAATGQGSATPDQGGGSGSATLYVCPATGCTATSCHGATGAPAPGGNARSSSGFSGTCRWVRDERLTLAVFMDRWLESVKLTIRPSTYRRYEQISRQHIVPTLGRIRLVRLTPDQVHKPLNERLESGLSARSVQHILGCLRSALSQAISWQIVQRNVASLVTPPRAVPHEIQPFTPEEAKETAGKTGRRDVGMLALILSLILVIVVFGLGFAMKALFWVALALLIIWVIGFLVGRGRRRRWYW